MILAIDIGNSNIVVGVYNDKLKSKYRMQTLLNETADGYGIRIYNLLKHDGYQSTDFEGIIIASVVPVLDYTFTRLCLKYFHQEPMFVMPGTKSGIKIKIDNPKQLGADLLVAAVAGAEKYSLPLIIIDMGTAITISVIDKEKSFVGGVIYPGLSTSFNSLTKNTAKLEEVRIEKINTLIGKDTVSSIQSGMLYGTAAMLDGMINKIKKSYPEAVVILTGGHSRILKEYMEEKVTLDNDLVLDGLRIVYKKNKKN
ncbi:MAG: type III pantothenate kinase [Bacilli bacterium]|jgi:type III pantothenate kinase|nr:type III pantothenate kinase [Bacilli bacterium]MDD2681372.1 type III pantothenate kinase [Bacilli bacterium]MDD3120881.1 type III pantothenate kinase [Bacilli bacterium]MDD4063076.1 type III pantothenate kinase [Bacilli bacterium]MDD4481644.1 type III pantothenate kinase [Bacilli bacterium]